MSNSLWPHGLYSSWNSLGQNTGVGSLSLLQGIFPIQGLNPGHLHCRQILYHLSDILHIIRPETQQQVRARRPKRGEDAPPGTLLTATSSEVRRPPEGQEAKLRHTSPSNRARAVKLYVSIHKGEGAWNIIFLLMILIKGEQSTFWEKFPAGYLMRDWPEVRVSRADKQCPQLWATGKQRSTSQLGISIQAFIVIFSIE